MKVSKKYKRNADETLIQHRSRNILFFEGISKYFSELFLPLSLLGVIILQKYFQFDWAGGGALYTTLP